MATKRKKTAAKSKAKKAAKAVRKASPKKKAVAKKKAAPKKKASIQRSKRSVAGTERTLIVLFNLRRGVSAAAYEKWARDTDVPIAGGLKSVKEFKVYRAEGILGSKAKPPYRYFEILHISGLDALVGDIGKEPRMQAVAAAFQKFADNPTFVVTENFAG
ncbi:MAG: hypothetical protein RID42_06735 [Alphaproteobacteria bacterium]|jgi:hypothetical protein